MTVARLKNLEGKDFRIKEITQRTVALIGQKGSGKTLTMRQLIMDGIPKATPILTIDCVGALKPPNAVIIGLEKPQKWNAERWAGFFRIVRRLWNDKQPLVVNLGSMRQVEKVFFGDRMAAWAIRNLKSGVIIVDEVHELCPESEGSYSMEFDRLVRHGRSKGDLGFMISTQRPQMADKNLLGLCDYFFFFRILWHTDADVVKKLLKYHTDKERTQEVMASLNTFNAFECWALDVLP